MSNITSRPKREVEFASMSKVENHLLNMMEEVRSNPKSIPQAVSMCEIASRLIDVKKTQIEEVKLLIRMHELGRIELDLIN